LSTVSTARWAEVDLRAVAHNVAELRARLQPGTRLCVVVKANAYGHGAVPVARAAVSAGADWLAVATVAEGAELRGAGIDGKILNLGPTFPEAADEAIGLGLDLGVSDREGIEALQAAADRAGHPARLHLKIDTGMARLGAASDTAVDLARLITGSPGSELAGVWTHFAEADDPVSPRTGKQLVALLGEVDRLRRAGVQPGIVHAANSAATLLDPATHLDMVRCGLPVYGYSPTSAPIGDLDLRPALTWKARVVALHVLQPGDRVGYGGTFVAEAPTRVATISVGYADGYRRALSGVGEVLVRGRRAPLAGRVSMDFTAVDVTGIDGVDVGDEAVLVGAQGSEVISAEEVAAAAGTISWDILAGIGPRVARVYDGD